MNCIFCSIYENKKESIIYESSKSFVILDRFPMSKGHMLAIPKTHKPFLHECDPEDLKDIISTIHYVSNKMGLESYNILQNNKNYQSVFHVHFHIIPRISEEQRLKIEWTNLDIKEEEHMKQVEESRKTLNK